MGELVRLREEESVVSEFLGRFKSQNTIEAYKNDIENFFGIDIGFISNLKLKLVNYKDVQDYVKKMFNDKKSDNTIRRRISSLSSLFDDAICAEVVGKNYFNDDRIRKLISVREEKGVVKGIALSKREISELLGKIDNKRDRVMIGFMLRTGVRVSEVVGIKWEDFIEKDGKWYVKVLGKGNKWRIVNIGERVVGEIKDYMKCYKIKENEKLFNMSTRNVNLIIKKYEEKISSHDCRRTYITNLLKDGVGLVKVQKAAGHSNARTTEGYWRDNEDWESDIGEMVSW